MSDTAVIQGACARPSFAEDWGAFEEFYEECCDSKPAVDESAMDPKIIDVYYEHFTGRYAYRTGEVYTFGREGQIRRHLEARGYSGAQPKDGGWSEIDRVFRIIEHENAVDIVMPLGARPIGKHMIGNMRILCPRTLRLVQPRAGTWEVIKAIICGILLTPEQVEVFYSWLRISLIMVYDGEPRRGQAFVLAGPPGCGKTLMLGILKLLFGGQCAEPYSFLQGVTDFNEDLFSVVLLIMDDDNCDDTRQSKRAFASRLKKVVATHDQRMHPKGGTALQIPTIWRLAVALNDDHESLGVLPDVNDTLKDKLHLLQAHHCELPVDTGVTGGEETLKKLIESELPAFVHFILKEFVVPAHLAGGRYGMRHYHNPELLQRMQGDPPAEVLLDLIDSSLFELRESQLDHDWVGSASALERIIHRRDPVSARALFHAKNVCGILLSELAGRPNPRVARGTEVRGLRRWIISPKPLLRGISDRRRPASDVHGTSQTASSYED